MRVWMDMANSPHPMLLGPVADELERAGHLIWVTARDHAQTAELTWQRWPEANLFGGRSPTSRAGKLRTQVGRVRSLRREASRQAPDVAVSLNSYAQMAAARALGVPTVTVMDYEFQPANHIGFRLANRIVVPTSFPRQRLRIYGAHRDSRVFRFDGYKEELYLDRSSRPGNDGWSGIEGSETMTRLLFRPPPSGAMYHREGNNHFDELLVRAALRENASVLVLSRFPEQRARYRKLPGVHVAEHAVDGFAALLGAHAFLGAGGTMCREAALLGVPAYTLFGGRLAAVDARLIAEGRLRDLRSTDFEVEDVADDAVTSPPIDWEAISRRAGALRAWLVSVIEGAARPGAPVGSSERLFRPA
jgi:uncharacterized protein